LPEGAVVLIVRALYGLKSSGARFRDAMVNTLHLRGFQSSKADPDIWMCAAVKPNGGTISRKNDTKALDEERR
jgi:hypothetical protein